ncbi:MAG: cell division protein SepF, partial [Acetatifactor sp.]|nr:cell division protein SepF [Acetatifactor sp.]
MGVMDKFLNYMRLNEDEDGYYDDDYYDDDMEDVPASKKKTSTVKESDDIPDEKPVKKATTGKVMQMRQPSTRKLSGSSGLEVCGIK